MEAGGPLAAYVLVRSDVAGLAQLQGRRIGVTPLGDRAAQHADAALRSAHLEGMTQPVSDADAMKRLIGGDLEAVVVDIDRPPDGLSDLPVERYRMIPIFAPGL
ncbi:hypothetical protein [Alsobacter metallidurans]|uniref:hypothetical protein n=1 Tax=Alsobacter metallidurans TaxID=340221 RepID=UPI00166A75A0|nr:hypothetical protein [Alsobacter metallidurans]